jgi:hypothetical protein
LKRRYTKLSSCSCPNDSGKIDAVAEAVGKSSADIILLETQYLKLTKAPQQGRKESTKMIVFEEQRREILAVRELRRNGACQGVVEKLQNAEIGKLPERRWNEPS